MCVLNVYNDTDYRSRSYVVVKAVMQLSRWGSQLNEMITFQEPVLDLDPATIRKHKKNFRVS